RAPIAFGGDLHDISILKANVVAKTETVSSKEVDMNLSRLAVPFKLEMMVLNILQAVTHFGFPGAKCFAPEHAPIPFDGRGHRYRFEFRIDYKFRTKGTGAELRAREVQIVLFFKLMIRKLIAHRKANSIRLGIRSDEINACDFGLLASVLGITGNVERLSVGT